MEIVHGKYQQKSLSQVASGQFKHPARVELQIPAKKVLSVTSACFINGVDRTESDIRVSGKTTTRVVFIDEHDGFNSEEHHDTWTERLALPRDARSTDGVVMPAVHILETTIGKNGKNGKTEQGYITAVHAEHVINISVLGLAGQDVDFVQDLRGNVETKRDKMRLSTFGGVINERFEISESFTLDANVEGILGVDLNAAVRDIICNDGRISIKGTVCAGISTVKTGDGGSEINNAFHEWDFTKTITNKEIGTDDAVCGSLAVCNLTMKVESRDKPELVIDAELLFTGHTTATHEIEVVQDAFSYDNHLNMMHADVLDASVTPQSNVMVDVEGNVSMPEGSSYIGKVLWAGTPTVGGINAVAGNGKVTVEGVLTAHLVYECDEKNVFSHVAQVPFSTSCKVEDCTKDHDVSVAVAAMSCNIKARRGKELLVDARLALNVSANSATLVKITSSVKLGDPKARDESAITIHIAGQSETLWDIAKRTSIPTAEIVKQNPTLEHGINEGERIVLYRQEVVSF